MVLARSSFSAYTVPNPLPGHLSVVFRRARRLISRIHYGDSSSPNESVPEIGLGAAHTAGASLANERKFRIKRGMNVKCFFSLYARPPPPPVSRQALHRHFCAQSPGRDVMRTRQRDRSGGVSDAGSGGGAGRRSSVLALSR